ncbi:41256_t:CDS:2, partial [Gigaspora margarita]
IQELIELSKRPQQLLRKFKDLQKKVKKLEEEKLVNNYLTLQERTEQKEKELNAALEECKKEMKLLKEQEMVSKYNDDYLVRKKEGLIKIAPEKFSDRLKELCKLKDELTQLEAQINNKSVIINQGQGDLNNVINENTLNYANFTVGEGENIMKNISSRVIYERLKEIFSVVLPDTPLNFDALISLEKRKLLAEAKSKAGKELEFFLNSLLEVQGNIIKIGNDPFVQKHLQDIKNVLIKKLSEKELDKICQLKKEITQLEQATKLKEKKLMRRKKKEKELFQAQIEIPLKKIKDNYLQNEINKREEQLENQMGNLIEKGRSFMKYILGRIEANDQENKKDKSERSFNANLEKELFQAKDHAVKERIITENEFEHVCQLKKEVLELKDGREEGETIEKKIEIIRLILDSNITVERLKKRINQLEEKCQKLEEENARNSFLSSLEEVIKELKDCYDELKAKTNIKHTKIDATIKGINDVGGSFDNPVKIVNPIKLVTGVIGTLNEHYKINFRLNRSEEFKKYLENNERNTFSFNETYDSLVDIIRENEELKISSNIIDILDLKCVSKSGNIEEFKSFNIRYDKIYNIVNSQNEEY